MTSTRDVTIRHTNEVSMTLDFNDSRVVQTIRDTFAKFATPEEFTMFLGLCKKLGENEDSGLTVPFISFIVKSMKKLFTTTELAESLQVSRMTVYHWVKAGLPYEWRKDIGKRSYRVFSLDDAIRFAKTPRIGAKKNETIRKQ